MKYQTLSTAQLREARAAARDRADAIIGTAERASRGMTNDEDAQFRAHVREMEAIGLELDKRDERAARSQVPESQRGTSLAAHDDRRSFLPSWNEYRAATEGRAMGSDGTATFLIPTEQSTLFFDRLRPESVVLSAGARVVPMASNTLGVPVIATSAAVAIVAENSEISSSDLTFQARNLRAYKLAALCRCSNEALADSLPALREVVAFDLVRAIAAKLDSYLLAGTGAGQPVGLRHAIGATTTTLGTGNGFQPTLDDILDAIGRVQTANGRPSAVFMAPRTWGYLRSLKSGDGEYLPES